MNYNMAYNQIKHVLSAFRFEGRYSRAEELHSGNVNNTYHLYYALPGGGCAQYVLQQINTYAFKKPDEVMSNIVRVTEYLRGVLAEAGEDSENRVLTCIPTVTGEFMFRDDQNRYWRAYRYIHDAVAYDRVEKPEHFYEAGRAFGEFQRMLGGFPVNELYDTIPNFHDTRKRFYTFVASVAEDRAHRVAELDSEIDFFFDRRKMMSEIVRKIESHEIPLRVTHNDTKINNIMLDAQTGRAVCVIDLDTVMAGSALYDYGDAIRYGASTADEDEPDTSKIDLNMDLFREFTRGFLSEVGDLLTEAELKCLPLSLKVMTCELAMRFLTDYTDGDVYFKVNSPDHNLIRAHAQMKLLERIEEKYDQICAITEEIIRNR